MIIRDENGNPLAAEKVSDVTEALGVIEKKLGSDIAAMSDEEKKTLVTELSDMKDIISLVTPELQKGSNPLELMKFMKQVLKIKGAAEKFIEKNNDL